MLQCSIKATTIYRVIQKDGLNFVSIGLRNLVHLFESSCMLKHNFKKKKKDVSGLFIMLSYQKILTTNILPMFLGNNCLSMLENTEYFCITSFISFNLFSFCGSIQDYKIHMDMEIVIFA